MDDTKPEFAERQELINAILTQEGLAFRVGMSDEECEALDATRQFWVLQHGIPTKTTDQLRDMVR